MQFTLTIKIGNDAMSTNEHLALALKRVVRCIEREHPLDFNEDTTSDWPSACIRDENGNKVGEWEIT